MYPPKKILFPTDFSERSAALAPIVVEFTRRFNAALTLLHVALLEEEQSPDVRLRIDAFAAIELAGARTECPVITSDLDAGEEIVRFAQKRQIDLIMMPTHGYGVFRRLLFGSVTLKVLDKAECPVWTSAHAEQMPMFRDIAFRNVVCALDRSNKSCQTLKWAAQFAGEYGAKLTIVHAIPSLIGPGVEYIDTTAWQEEMAAEARSDFANQLKQMGRDADVNIVIGEPAQAVRLAAEAAHADLLVIGRSAAGGPLGRLRTHAFPIIRQSPCPVTSV